MSPMNRKDYSPNWKTISKKIICRSWDRCELCDKGWVAVG
jgi:hypothetical protein